MGLLYQLSCLSCYNLAMEQDYRNHRDDENSPEIPDDISELVDDIQDRADQRRKALEIGLENARKAETQEQKEYWMLKAMEFGDILDEYTKSMYPELFPNDDPSSPEQG